MAPLRRLFDQPLPQKCCYTQVEKRRLTASGPVQVGDRKGNADSRLDKGPPFLQELFQADSGIDFSCLLHAQPTENRSKPRARQTFPPETELTEYLKTSGYSASQRAFIHIVLFHFAPMIRRS